MRKNKLIVLTPFLRFRIYLHTACLSSAKLKNTYKIYAALTLRAFIVHRDTFMQSFIIDTD